MAKKNGKDADEGAAQEPTRRLTPPNTVKNLLKSLRGQAEDIAKIRGEMGGAVSDAVKNKFLHKKAFGDIRRLDKLGPEKLADWKAHFDYYWDVCGLADRAKSAPKFSEVEEQTPKPPPGAGASAKPDKGDGKIAQFPTRAGSA